MRSTRRSLRNCKASRHRDAAGVRLRWRALPAAGRRRQVGDRLDVARRRNRPGECTPVTRRARTDGDTRLHHAARLGRGQAGACCSGARLEWWRCTEWAGGLEPESDLARRRQFRCHAQRYRCDLRSEMAVALARLGIEAAPEAVSGIKTAMYRAGMGVFYSMKEQAELAQGGRLPA